MIRLEDERERRESAISIDYRADFQQAVETAKLSIPFKIHTIVAAALSGVCFFIWLLVDFAVTEFPWFLYPAFVALSSLLIHFYIWIKPKQFLHLHFALATVLNLTLLLTWIFSHDDFAWFVYPLAGSALIFLLHFGAVKWRQNEHGILYVHIGVFTIINVMLFLLWTDIKGGDWFLIAFFALAIPLSIHWTIHYHPRQWFRFHLVLYTSVQLLFFFTWAVADMNGLPWFIFPAVVWGIGLGIHGFVNKGKETPLPTTDDVRVEFDPEVQIGRNYDPEDAKEEDQPRKSMDEGEDGRDPREDDSTPQ